MQARCAVLAAALPTCSGDASSTDLCAPEPGRARSALTSGAADPAYLGLAPEEANAVVAVVARFGAAREICSGVVVGSTLVMTAAHCVTPAADRIQVFVGPSISCPVARAEASLATAHESLDLALLQISALDAAQQVTPFACNREPLPDSMAGTVVQLGGFGTTGVEPPDQRLFLAEPIADVRTDSVVVDGEGRSGACAGDSGGPLLVRDSSGAASVLGLLTVGSDDCRGRDLYARVDVAWDWLSGWVQPQQPTRACGSIDQAGRCLNGVAVRCVDGKLQAERCLHTAACAWSAQGYYACQASPGSRCGALTQQGECDGDRARVCVQGTVSAVDCAELGTSCGRSPHTGAATCLGGQ